MSSLYILRHGRDYVRSLYPVAWMWWCKVFISCCMDVMMSHLYILWHRFDVMSRYPVVWIWWCHFLISCSMDLMLSSLDILPHGFDDVESLFLDSLTSQQQLMSLTTWMLKSSASFWKSTGRRSEQKKLPRLSLRHAMRLETSHAPCSWQRLLTLCLRGKCTGTGPPCSNDFKRGIQNWLQYFKYSSSWYHSELKSWAKN